MRSLVGTCNRCLPSISASARSPPDNAIRPPPRAARPTEEITRGARSHRARNDGHRARTAARQHRNPILCHLRGACPAQSAEDGGTPRRPLPPHAPPQTPPLLLTCPVPP